MRHPSRAPSSREARLPQVPPAAQEGWPPPSFKAAAPAGTPHRTQRTVDGSSRICEPPSPRTARNVTAGIFVFSDQHRSSRPNSLHSERPLRQLHCGGYRLANGRPRPAKVPAGAQRLAEEQRHALQVRADEEPPRPRDAAHPAVARDRHAGSRRVYPSTARCFARNLSTAAYACSSSLKSLGKK